MTPSSSRLNAALAGVIAVLLVAGVVATRQDGAVSQPALVIHKVDEARFEPLPGEPLFVLVIGNDGRPGVGGERGDALHLVGVNPASGQATILNFPRDTYVAIPGHGRNKINAAYQFGGPRLQAEAVGNLVGVHIPYVIATDFAGFRGMVDELGGVVVDVPFAMNDKNSGAVFDAGPTLLNGDGALAFSRNRYIPGGDIRRSEHQGVLIVSALAKLRAETSGPYDTLRLLGVLARNTRLDGVGFRELYLLGRLALSLDPANVRNVTMPATTGQAGGASVVFPTAAAPGVFEDFRDDGVLQSH